jgi:hypothetical protein
VQRRSEGSSASFLSLLLPGYSPGNGQVASGWGAETLGSSQWLIHWSLYNRACKSPMLFSLAAFGSGLWFSFSGVPIYMNYAKQLYRKPAYNNCCQFFREHFHFKDKELRAVHFYYFLYIQLGLR